MQLQFKSLYANNGEGTLYTLTIGSASGTLTGAAEPFVTQEADDADMFLPIRTQSGYVRIVGIDDRATWLSLIPNGVTSILVKLTHGNNVIDWQGFMTPGVFSNEWPSPEHAVMEHEFPVQCPLSVLDGIDMDVQDPTPNHIGIVTFGQLLQHIFGKLTDPSVGVTINHYYIQGTAAVTNARLDLKIIWANFLETDNTGTIVAKYTCYQVLEEVCKFFGYTCRMQGDAVYFTQPTGNTLGFTEYSHENLYNSSTHQAVSGTYSERGSFSILNNMLASNDMEEQVVPGVGKVTVSSDINKLDNLIEIPYDELFDRYFTGHSIIIVRSVDYYEHDIYCSVRAPFADNTSMVYENDSVSMECYMATNPGSGHSAGNKKKYCRFIVYDDDEVGPVGGTPPKSKKAYSWKKCIELFHSYNYPNYGTSGSDDTTMFSITSKQSFIVSDGYLYISFKCDEVSAWIGSVNFYAIIKIGNLYWNGFAWVERTAGQAEPSFYMQFNASGACSNRSGVDAPQYDGWGIPVTDTMRGVLEFKILDVEKSQKIDPDHITDIVDINGFLPLMDFEIGFVRGTIEEKRHNGNEYTKTGGSFRENVGVDLIFAADVTYGPQNYQRHMPAGLGYILNYSDEKPSATIMSMTGYGVTPEEYLATLIANYGLNTHRIVDVDVRTDLVGNVTPAMIDGGLCGGMFPMAISHNWCDDITHITLITL